ncbi:MAG: hypothetical protein K1X88_34040 [Nannocystaceae bacterium]|nr:hypothetical protein [Nannocystaceae bacterium]
MKRLATISFLGMTLAACAADGGGGNQDGGDSSSTGGGEMPVDERVEVPADGPDVLNFGGAEFVVQAGEDVMMCYSVDYTGGEVAYKNAISLQGKGGHHVILLGAKEPLAAGTVEDCSDGMDMSKYDLLMIPQELPPGYGTILPAGRHMVIQSHYVNTTDHPILVRDFVQLDLIPMEEVQTFAAPIATNTIDITLEPGKTGEVSFDCTIDEDVELLMVGGHMHEWGTKFETKIGPSVDELESLYLVDPWHSDFRDVPPVTLFLDNPKAITAGTVIRTSCYWNNTESEAIKFPHEMCSTFGILAGIKDPIECRLGE